jgi:hypothetical protein
MVVRNRAGWMAGGQKQQDKNGKTARGRKRRKELSRHEMQRGKDKEREAQLLP